MTVKRNDNTDNSLVREISNEKYKYGFTTDVHTEIMDRGLNEDVIRMISETPSKIMGVYDRKGSLERGKDADILLLDKDLNVAAVWAMGKLVKNFE